MNTLGSVGSIDNDNEEQLHEEIHSNLEEYNSIDMSDMAPVENRVQELSQPVMGVEITSEEELKFLRTLMVNEKEDNEENELEIGIVIKIGDILKPVGRMIMNYENLIKIRVYNPRINISIITQNSMTILKDEDIVCL